MHGMYVYVYTYIHTVLYWQIQCRVTLRFKFRLRDNGVVLNTLLLHGERFYSIPLSACLRRQINQIVRSR